MQFAQLKNRFAPRHLLFFTPALAVVAIVVAGASNAAERGRGFVAAGGGTGAYGRVAAGPAGEFRGLPAFRGNFARAYPGGAFAGRPASAFGYAFGPSRLPGAPRIGGAGLFARNGLPRRPFPGEAGFTGVPLAGESRFVAGEMVVFVANDVPRESLDAAAGRLGLSLIGSQTLSTGTLAQFRVADGRPVEDAIRSFETAKIGIAQPNYLYTLQQGARVAPTSGSPTGPGAGAATATSGKGDPSQYVVGKLQLNEVHRIATGENVLVAVIDSEIDATHPDLAGSIVGQFDAIVAPDAPDEHGTGMTGAIAAHRKVVGVAPRARILAIHAFSPNAQSQAATSQSIVAGIDRAIEQGARVINMSFAGPYDPILQVALKKAHDKGVVLVAAAGNMGPKSPPLYPAADENVIAVTATDSNDRLLAEANRGPHIALAAPGVEVLETTPHAGYGFTTGTSVAAAHVSGVVALLIERDPAIDVATVENILFTTAKDLGAPGRDEQFGYGLVDPYRALNALNAQVARGAGTVGRLATLAPDRAGAGPSAVATRVTSPGATPAAAAQKSAFTPSASEPPPLPGATPSTSSPSQPPSSAATTPIPIARPTSTERPTGTATIMRLTQATPNPSPAPGAAPNAPLDATPEDLADSQAAVQKRRLTCRQEGLGKGMRNGPDLVDYVTICVAEARVGCLKQAVDQKVRGPARRDYLNKCLLGP
jgi:subtilisin family serine protease